MKKIIKACSVQLAYLRYMILSEKAFSRFFQRNTISLLYRNVYLASYSNNKYIVFN